MRRPASLLSIGALSFYSGKNPMKGLLSSEKDNPNFWLLNSLSNFI